MKYVRKHDKKIVRKGENAGLPFPESFQNDFLLTRSLKFSTGDLLFTIRPTESICRRQVSCDTNDEIRL